MTLSVVRGIRGLRVLWWQHLLYDKLCSCSESRQLHNKFEVAKLLCVILGKISRKLKNALHIMRQESLKQTKITKFFPEYSH